MEKIKNYWRNNENFVKSNKSFSRLKSMALYDIFERYLVDKTNTEKLIIALKPYFRKSDIDISTAVILSAHLNYK